MIKTYNYQVSIHGSDCVVAAKEGKDVEKEALDRVNKNPKQIKWTRGLIKNLCRLKTIKFTEDSIGIAAYRPFCKSWIYYDRLLNEYYKERIFPTSRHKNLVIIVTGPGSSKEFSCLVTDTLPDLEIISKSQCFPLYVYGTDKPYGEEFLEQPSETEVVDGYHKRDGIPNNAVVDFQAAYGKSVAKEDIFYYVYGILHSPEYRRRFSADLKKMLPRIPLTKEATDFWKFSKAGRELAQWHVNYESVEPYPLTESSDTLNLDPAEFYKVRKMTWGRKNKLIDKSVIVYNSNLVLSGIPLEAYGYVVNGKPALEWIMERYQVTVDKDSGIRNDPNDWMRESGDWTYVVNLIKRVVRVSLETMRIVEGLPALNERA